MKVRSKFAAAVASAWVCVAPASSAAEESEHLTEMFGKPNSDLDNVTLKSQAVPLFTEGRLTACSLNFSVVHRNTAHMQGDYALIEGSASLWYAKDNAIILLMKLGVTRLEGLGTTEPHERTAPAEIALIANRTRTNAPDLIESSESQPGFRTTIFRPGETGLEAWAQAGAFQRLEGYYTLSEGGLGSNFYADLRVANFDPSRPDLVRLSERAGRELQSCTADLLALAEADLSD